MARNLKNNSLPTGIDHPTCLGLDIGGTATRWHLLNANGAVSGVTSGSSGHLKRAEVRVQMEHVLRDIVTQTGPVDAITAGVTGISRNSTEARLLSEMLQRSFEAQDIRVMSDIELAHRAAFPAGTGILVYAGTGSIAAHVTSDGNLVTAGGKGVLIDDAGGGYWIGVQGLRYVLRAEDRQPGSGWSSPIGAAMRAYFAETDWASVRTHFYALDRGGVGRLAIAVQKAALDHDPVALGILEKAGLELAELASMLLNRIGPQPMTLAGRAGRLHPAIHAALVDRLGPITVADAADGATARAAALLARLSTMV